MERIIFLISVIFLIGATVFVFVLNTFEASNLSEVHQDRKSDFADPPAVERSFLKIPSEYAYEEEIYTECMKFSRSGRPGEVFIILLTSPSAESDINAFFAALGSGKRIDLSGERDVRDDFVLLEGVPQGKEQEFACKIKAMQLPFIDFVDVNAELTAF